MAHGFVNGDRAERAAMWREIETRNREASRNAARSKFGEGFNPQGLVSGHAKIAEQAREFAERYEQ
jgi:hypothetical protein